MTDWEPSAELVKQVTDDAWDGHHHSLGCIPCADAKYVLQAAVASGHLVPAEDVTTIDEWCKEAIINSTGNTNQ